MHPERGLFLLIKQAFCHILASWGVEYIAPTRCNIQILDVSVVLTKSTAEVSLHRSLSKFRKLLGKYLTGEYFDGD